MVHSGSNWFLVCRLILSSKVIWWNIYLPIYHFHGFPNIVLVHLLAPELAVPLWQFFSPFEVLFRPFVVVGSTLMLALLVKRKGLYGLVNCFKKSLHTHLHGQRRLWQWWSRVSGCLEFAQTRARSWDSGRALARAGIKEMKTTPTS